jgi:orotidine-5'-phosphate decarboxylase
MLALDVNSVTEAKELLEATAPFIAAVKIGWQLMLRSGEGPAVVRSIAKVTSVPILLDAKIHDALHIAQGMISTFKDQGAQAIMIWEDVGPIVLSQCMTTFPSLELFLLTGLTAADERNATTSVSGAIHTAKTCGCMNLQVPGNYPSLVAYVRRELGPSACLVSCGIGAQGGEPGGAAAAGADYEIVGRDIYLARDPRSIAEEYQNLILENIRRRTASPTS